MSIFTYTLSISGATKLLILPNLPIQKAETHIKQNVPFDTSARSRQAMRVVQ